MAGWSILHQHNRTTSNRISPKLDPYKIQKMMLETIFGGVGATIGDVQSGSLLVAIISDTGLVQLDYFGRLRFTDS